jgi:hypothetical protein
MIFEPLSFSLYLNTFEAPILILILQITPKKIPLGSKK